MSPCTNRLQRSTRSVAPFSGLSASVCADPMEGKSAAPVPSVATVATPAEPSRKRRRLICLSVIVMSPLEVCLEMKLRGEPRAVAGIEEMRMLRVGNEVDGAARREIVTLAKDRRNVGRAMPAGHEGIGAGRLENDDARRDAALGSQDEMLGPCAEDDALPVDSAGVHRRSEPRAVGQLEARALAVSTVGTAFATAVGPNT